VRSNLTPGPRPLNTCCSVQKHQEYKALKSQQRRRAEERERAQERQEAVQSRAAWELLGAESTQLWLLDETELRNVAAERGVEISASTDKDRLIALIARESAVGGRTLTDGGRDGTAGGRLEAGGGGESAGGRRNWTCSVASSLCVYDSVLYCHGLTFSRRCLSADGYRGGGAWRGARRGGARGGQETKAVGGRKI